jgi:mannose-1-phosphate guanylyltransferase
MLQNTVDRANRITSDVYVVTEASHADEVAKQLPQLSADRIIIEPARRGTAACFILGLARISEDHSDDESVVFIHADHHIPDLDKFSTAVRAASAASASRGSIALVGVAPTYPATGLGYIQCGSQIGEEEELPVYRVKAFKEKPTFDVAKRYLKAGKYLWNQGLFAAPLRTWVQEFKDFAPNYYKGYQDLKSDADTNEIYLGLENIAIDYALIEKTPHLVVVPALYDWADIGSFRDLHKVLKGENGNSLKGNVHQINCEDCMIHATDKPVIAIGLSGIVVVDTPEGLLVCSKEQSHLVGELSKKLAAEQANNKTKA